MPNPTLRDYQKYQCEFLDYRLEITDKVAIESPTGSGKTYVMLELARNWLDKPENHLSNVVISTGFNNLVFALERSAKLWGFEPIVLIGKKACNCPEKARLNGAKFKLFTEDAQYVCGSEHKHLDLSVSNFERKECPYTKQAYTEYYQKMTQNVGQLIITNHSSLLIHQKALENTSLLIIDEAHTFANFYDSFLKLELDKNELMQMHNSIKKIKQPMQSIIQMNIRNEAPLPQIQVEKVCESIEDSTLSGKVREFFETKPELSNYIEVSQNQYCIHKFYKSFELSIKPKIALFTATLDQFTIDMFGVRNVNIYRERKQFCDYSKSEFIAIPDASFQNALKRFIKYVNKKELNSGLILSTTINDVNLALEINDFMDYKMFTSVDDFVSYNGKKILVASRRLFQGVDIANLDFVALNKIPFPLWDDKARAQERYLTNNGTNNYDSWKKFVLPKTENDVIQATGRLWRNIESKGVVSIFETTERIQKFKYIIDHTMNNYRHGIVINIMDENDEVKLFNIKEGG